MLKNNCYIIKNLAPWMMDELLAFSKESTFSIYFLRRQADFYSKNIQTLEDLGVHVHYRKNSLEGFRKKIKIIITFIVKNISSFSFNYNGIIGVKSILWFLLLDISYFSSKNHIHAQFATQASLIALYLKKYYSNNICYSFTFHAHDIYIQNKWFKLLVNESSNAFSISEYNIKYVTEHYIKSNKITLSRLGVFKQNESKKRNIEKFTKPYKIGLLSWFVEKKGIIYLLETMLSLKNKGINNYSLHLAGDGPLLNSLKAYVDDNSLGNVIHFLGSVHDERKRIFFEDLDVFVLPSISLDNDKDGIPVVLMEAISFGLPIISTNISGIPEICINDFNGILIEERRSDLLEQALIKLFDDFDYYSKLSNNSFTMSSSYNIEKNSRRKLSIMGWI